MRYLWTFMMQREQKGHWYLYSGTDSRRHLREVRRLFSDMDYDLGPVIKLIPPATTPPTLTTRSAK